MLEVELIGKKEAEQVQQSSIELNVSERKQNVAYQSFIDLTIKEAAENHGISLEELREKRYKIVTSLRPEFQEIAYEYFQYDGYFPGNNDKLEGAFVMMDEVDWHFVADSEGGKIRVRDWYLVHV